MLWGGGGYPRVLLARYSEYLVAAPPLASRAPVDEQVAG